jgi:predicted hydrolase (HD superfamily)
MVIRDEALELLKEYNKEVYHIRHALTVEAVMRWFAVDQGYEDEQAFWGLVGLVHDLDFEMFPDEHCAKAPELLARIGATDQLIHAVCSHGYGLCESSPKPEHQMEKILFAADELTGLIYSASLMRPSRSTKDMELPSLKKKFKDKTFAAGCSRDVIAGGADMLEWPLDELMGKTLEAMRQSEDAVRAELQALTGAA